MKTYTLKAKSSPVRVYLELMTTFSSLSPKETDFIHLVLVNNIKGVITEDIKQIITTEFNFTAQQYAQYIYNLSKKKALVKTEEGVTVHQSLIPVIKDNTISVTFNIRKDV
jgi:hypothetical protein